MAYKMMDPKLLLHCDIFSFLHPQNGSVPDILVQTSQYVFPSCFVECYCIELLLWRNLHDDYQPAGVPGDEER